MIRYFLYENVTWKSEKQLGKSARFVLVSGPGVLLQGGVHPLPQLLHPVDVLEALHVRVEENDGTQAAQLSLVQSHLLHLGDQLDEDSVEDPAHPAGVSVLPGDHDTIGQQDPWEYQSQSEYQVRERLSVFTDHSGGRHSCGRTRQSAARSILLAEEKPGV